VDREERRKGNRKRRELYLFRFTRLPFTVPVIVLQLGLSWYCLLSARTTRRLRPKRAPPFILDGHIAAYPFAHHHAIATELPGKDKLHNLGGEKQGHARPPGTSRGAMVFQSCFSGCGSAWLFTEWNLKGATLVSAACPWPSAFVILAWVKVRNPSIRCPVARRRILLRPDSPHRFPWKK